MKKKEWNEGLNHIDPDLVTQYVEQKERLVKRSRTKAVWLRVGALAACLCLVVGGVLVIFGGQEDQTNDIPIWEGAQYSAEEIADLIGSGTYDGVGTNAYQKIYVSSNQYLDIQNMTEEQYLPVYQCNNQTKATSEKELEGFVERFLPKLAASLDTSVPPFSIQKNNSGIRTDLTSIGPYELSIRQTDRLTLVWFNKREGDKKIILGGKPVQIDQQLSDEEVIASLQPIKEELFHIFNVSFSDAKIIRKFDPNWKNGATFISVYFYDETAHPLNKTQSKPLSDYLLISFDNFPNYANDIVSNSVLTVADIEYRKQRTNIITEYAPIANAKRISLEEAENLLYRGYVFGGHYCSLCMADQDKICFEDYDFVDIEYVFGQDKKNGNPTMGIPFYAFYKKIGISENGNDIYAKTYVAAIEVSGYDEYFESQTKNHRSPILDEVG